ncbi:MAG TPA: DUF1697 domain-containing protein [Polyangiaceae bacterium]
MRMKTPPATKKASRPTKKAPRPGERNSGALKRTRVRRYAAFLRGVSPLNAKMPELKRCFEAAGFTDVKTVLGSGNVVFSAPAASAASLAARAEAAMQTELGHSFATIVRPVAALQAMLEADPFAQFRLARDVKRVVTFFKRAPKAKLPTPLTFESARILCVVGSEAFSAYVPGPRGPLFMRLIEKTFGKDITTRTWDTVKKVAK